MVVLLIETEKLEGRANLGKDVKFSKGIVGTGNVEQEVRNKSGIQMSRLEI
jgi:hypothetical protein